MNDAAMRPLIDFLHRQFLMHRRELYGMALLTLLLGLWLGSSQLATHFFSKTLPPLTPPLLDSLASTLPSDGGNVSVHNKAKKFPSPAQELFDFDPNTATLAEWQRLGAPQWLAQRIINYRNKGGYFYKKEDLQKIYGFPQGLYQALAPYIKINPSNKPNSSVESQTNAFIRPSYKEDKSPLIIELNTADTTALKQLRGIGSVYARRIVHYRELLGGFHSVEQLKEVYGLPEETYQSMLPFITIDTAQLRRIRINEADAETLARHPYLDKRKAKAMVAYRLQHGPFHSIDDLKKIKVLSEEEVNKLAPYLAF
ncbi:competence ComEA-like helix-hairpin-helix protein [Thermonema lapsum]|uniref:Competence ComEA-like helix-hairpin-helix protein n=1 Tax=Thermonema lapsum TaxID=28195 RepID=A0A846MTX4_9BACT|nr:helix-hairpin-helix domain-containing protein [Thermonema lapsum]NIK74677.1 competence ComEA-like helix-hairpin-helix protein [Thermonema lapsum]